METLTKNHFSERIKLIELLLKREGSADAINTVHSVKWLNDKYMSSCAFYFNIFSFSSHVILLTLYYLETGSLSLIGLVLVGIVKIFEIFAPLTTWERILWNIIQIAVLYPTEIFNTFSHNIDIYLKLAVSLNIGFDLLKEIGDFWSLIQTSRIVLQDAVMDILYFSVPIGFIYTFLFVHVMLDNNVHACNLVNTDGRDQQDYVQQKSCTPIESYLYVFLTLLSGDSIDFPIDDFKTFNSHFTGTLVVAIYKFFLETILFKGIVVGRIVARLPKYIKHSEGALCLIRLKTIMMMERIWRFKWSRWRFCWSRCNSGLGDKSVRERTSDFFMGLFYLPLPKE